MALYRYIASLDLFRVHALTPATILSDVNNAVMDSGTAIKTEGEVL